jgi:peptidoglycan hydrolase CwlO-like protein
MTPTFTIEVPQALTAQYNTLTSKLADIEQQQGALTAQRAEVEASLSRIQNAIRYLNGEMVPLVKEGPVRRPMSQEAKDRIRAGILAARAKKKAAIEAAQAPETAPAPVPAAATVNTKEEGTSGPNVASRLAAKKGARK